MDDRLSSIVDKPSTISDLTDLYYYALHNSNTIFKNHDVPYQSSCYSKEISFKVNKLLSDEYSEIYSKLCGTQRYGMLRVDKLNEIFDTILQKPKFDYLAHIYAFLIYCMEYINPIIDKINNVIEKYELETNTQVQCTDQDVDEILKNIDKYVYTEPDGIKRLMKEIIIHKKKTHYNNLSDRLSTNRICYDENNQFCLLSHGKLITTVARYLEVHVYRHILE